MNQKLIPLAVLAAALAACATTPAPNGALDQARTRVLSAQGDSQVATLAPNELKNAGESLRVAETAWKEGGSTTTVNHLAYMTGQRVTIAQETANNLAAQAVTTGAAAERDKMRLAVRTDEADTAKQQLAQKTAELATADAAGVRDKAMVDRSDARVSNLEMQLKEMNARKTDRGMVVTLGDVLFDSGRSSLQPDGSRNMAKLADVFKRNPDSKASIEGYTDSVGSASSNQDLSGRRAGAVMAALVSLGVPATHLSTQAHGEEMPVASNDTPAGRQMNRRVEIVFAQ